MFCFDNAVCPILGTWWENDTSCARDRPLPEQSRVDNTTVASRRLITTEIYSRHDVRSTSGISNANHSC